MMLLARSRIIAYTPARRGILPFSSLQSLNPDFSPNVLISESPINSAVTDTPKADMEDGFGQSSPNGGLRTECTAIVGTFRSMITKMHSHGHRPHPKSVLFKRQEAIELKIEEEAKYDRKELLVNLRRIGQSTSTQKVHHGLASWYEPLAQALKEEEEMIKKKIKGVDRQVYGPYLMLLPLDRVAIVALDVVVGQILRSDKSVKIVTLLTEIGSALENELNLERLRAMKRNNKAAMFAMKKLEELANNKKETGRVYKNVRKVLNDPEGWSPAIKTKIGGFLVETLVKTLHMPNGEPVFTCKYEYNDRTNKKAAVLVMSPLAYQLVDDSKNVGVIDPRWKPMVVPPKPWNSQAFYGAYLHLKAPLMKYSSRFQVDVVRKANIKPVLEGLDYLGKTPWRVNQRVFDVVLEAESKGMQLGEIPSAVNLVEPKKEDYLPPGQEDPSKVNQILYGQMKRRVAKRNAELHSLRQDMRIKLDIAEEFKNDMIFFPHNLDFRGRAYPVPPNLSHMGSDMCRGLLVFAEAKELGETGLRWLKIHLANLCGYNKVPYDQRVAWIDAHMGNIRESALHPLSGEMWWSTTESPFQALAACIELANAYELPDPTKHKCALPVHQDGSCNGLQHYAGLGRDALGGKAVNLAPSDSPQDVYSKVLEIVSQKLDKDAMIPEDYP
ncbi:hypothetical protein EON65_07390 [archaeon]|nr:MAG: hypothetical protein EON65_07390 [archaeon]